MTTKTGKLTSIGQHNLGTWHRGEYYRCVDCQTDYPVIESEDGALIQCNGRIIDLCPWCRPDSQPWKNGRGE